LKRTGKERRGEMGMVGKRKGMSTGEVRIE
jgi:hypothetical protein